MTKPTPDLTGLPQEVQESLETGRISHHEVNIIRLIVNKHGNERGLTALKYFEKSNHLKSYYEDITHGFKIHEFTFNCQTTSPEEVDKIAAALKEALATLSFYSRLGGF